MAEGGSVKIVILKSDDGEEFKLEESEAFLSQTIKSLIEECATDSPVPLPNVSSKILAKVVQYCKRHAQSDVKTDGDKSAEEELTAFDKEFVNVEDTTLFELICTANYLNISGLLDLTCQAVADSIKDKTPEEVRKIFDIKNDFTQEEEEAVRNEYAWAFE